MLAMQPSAAVLCLICCIVCVCVLLLFWFSPARPSWRPVSRTRNPCMPCPVSHAMRCDATRGEARRGEARPGQAIIHYFFTIDH